MNEYRFQTRACICFSVKANNEEDALANAKQIVAKSFACEGCDFYIHDDAIASRCYLDESQVPECVDFRKV